MSTRYDVELETLRQRRSVKWRRYPPDVLPVWVAEMDYPLADPVRDVLAEMVTRGDTGYAEFGGLAEAYVEFAARRYGAAVDPRRALGLQDVMRGVLVALELLTEPGAGVVINTPVYPPFFTTVRYAQRRVVEAPLSRDPAGRYQLDLDALERAFSAGARCWLLCSPHNPVGRAFSRAELTAAAALADRYDVTVLADEIHAPLTYPGARHVPWASLDAESASRSVTLVSASKAWNVAGLKCALAIAGSAAVWSAISAVPDEVPYGAGLLGVAASIAAFRDGERWLDDTLDYLDGNRRLLADLLAQRLPEVGYQVPEATYLAWLDCRRLELGDDPTSAFLDRGRVALSPGPTFGQLGAGFARLTSRPPGRCSLMRWSAWPPPRLADHDVQPPPAPRPCRRDH